LPAQQPPVSMAHVSASGLHDDNCVLISEDEVVFLTDFRDETDVSEKERATPSAGWSVVEFNPATCPNIVIEEAAVAEFQVAKMNIHGTIPTSLTICTSLVHINISNNKLHGPLPEAIGDLRALQTLWANDNLLSGEIPPRLAECTALVKLSLACNQFVGSVPPGLMAIQSLVALDCFGNLLENCEDMQREFQAKMKWCHVYI